MKITTLSADEFNGFRPRTPTIAIRIFDSIEDEKPLFQNKRFPFLEVLTLNFVDTFSKPNENQKHFSLDDLKGIKKIIENNPTAEELIIHCSLGIVRSTGVADGLSKVFGWEVKNGFWNDRTTYPDRSISSFIEHNYKDIVLV